VFAVIASWVLEVTVAMLLIRVTLPRTSTTICTLQDWLASSVPTLHVTV